MFRILGSLATLSLLLVAGLALRLQQGPIALDPLAPLIEDSLNRGTWPVRVDLGGVALTWSGGAKPLDLRLTDLVLTSRAGQPLVAMPEVAVTLSGTALLQGDIAVSTLDILRPRLHLLRDEEGHFALGASPLPGLTPLSALAPAIAPSAPVADSPAAPVADSPAAPVTDSPATGPSDGPAGVIAALDRVAALLDGDGGHHPLTRLALSDGELVIEDQASGIRAHLPRVTAALSLADDTLTLEIGAHLALPETRPRVDLVLRHRTGRPDADLGLGFSGIDTGALAEAWPTLGDLKTLDLALSGTIAGGLDLAALDGPDPWLALADIGFSLEGRDAYLVLPPPWTNHYHMPHITARGTLQQGLSRLTIDPISIDLGDSLLQGTLSGRDLLGTPELTATANLLSLHVEDLKRYWPGSAADGARDWVRDNLSQGSIQQSDFSFRFAGPSLAALDIVDLTGYALIDNLTVDYRNPLPPAEHVSGEVAFSLDGLAIDVARGDVRGLDALEIVTAAILFRDFTQPIQTADITVVAAGPLSEALALIDHDPLNYARAVGITPARARGNTRATARFVFPLLKDLTFDDVAVTVDADLEGVALPGLVFGHDLAEGTAHLRLDNQGMDVTGRARISGVPARLTWRENFTDSAPFSARYNVTASLDDAARARFGFDMFPFQPPTLTGSAEATLVFTRLDANRGTLAADLDLKPTTMAFAPLGWRKEAGAAGHARVDGRLEADRFVLDITAEVPPGLSFRGQTRLDPTTGALRRLDIDRLAVDRSWITGRVTVPTAAPESNRKEGVREDPVSPALPLTLTIDDGVVDFAPVLAFLNRDSPKDRPAPDSPAAPSPGAGRDWAAALPPLRADIALRSLLLRNGAALDGLTLQAERDGRLWRRIAARATPRRGDRAGLPLTLSLTPDPAAGGPDHPAGGRRFALETGDIGALLSALSVTDSLSGGALKITGRLDADGTARGLAEGRDLRLVKAPIIAQILSVAGLTGILDVLSGQGIGFSSLRVPFVHTPPLLTLTDARAAGPSLGLTTEGQLNLDTDRLDLKGTVVPAYALNSLVGHIPVLGELLIGGKGKGLIGVDYALTGTLAAPEVRVNPLSALTPGFLRGIFSVFDDSEPDQDPAPDRAPPPSPTAHPVTNPTAEQTAEPTAEPAPRPPPDGPDGPDPAPSEGPPLPLTRQPAPSG